MVRKLFVMKCPQCGYEYQYEGEEYEYESCPMSDCYKDKFREFVVEEISALPFYNSLQEYRDG